MKASFGWTLLSRDALRRAETQLSDDVDGVRDEVGFLALHQGYAERFFPGTSVLHTRLRYVLFVPWMYERLATLPGRQRVAAALEGCELELTRRLKEAGEDGVIGVRSYPRPTVQPPSMTYWSALATWRVLRVLPDGSYPSRATVHRAVAKGTPRQQLHDDDRQLLLEDEPIFGGVPRPPKAWHDANARIDFQLEPAERRFLRGCLLAVARPESDNVPSLLARLVEHNLALNERSQLWMAKIRDVADGDDRAALVRARQAAALSAIGRALYAALLETVCDEHDRLPTDKVHRSSLATVIADFQDDALALDIDAIAVDAPTVPGGILEVLHTTQDWLRGTSRNVMKLYDVYERAESRRKGRRARLTRSLAGREKRQEWQSDKHPSAKPLHYRWGNVRRLLMDLQG